MIARSNCGLESWTQGYRLKVSQEAISSLRNLYNKLVCCMLCIHLPYFEKLILLDIGSTFVDLYFYNLQYCLLFIVIHKIVR